MAGKRERQKLREKREIKSQNALPADMWRLKGEELSGNVRVK